MISGKNNNLGTVTSEDTTHLRWAGQSTNVQDIWKNYDKVIAPTIIQSALAKESSYDLRDLYQVLSIARLRCECEKELLDNEFEEDIFSIAQRSNFSAFQYGNSEETNLRDGWGEAVHNLLRERMGNSLVSHGLSSFSEKPNLFSDLPNIVLQHPEGPVLERMNPIFQRLITTDNFFEFLQLSACLMYNLSNFPPITRGSAAVNSWLIHGITQTRFNVSDNIRPLFYDWAAFFETPEQYVEFYVLSAITKYIKTIPSLYNAHQEFFDNIPDLLIKNPNIQVNMQERKKTWEVMQEYIAEALKSESLNSEQKKHLEAISQGTLKFREPSDAIRQLATNFQNLSAIKSKSVFAKMIIDSGYPVEKLKRLMHFHFNTTTIYLNANHEEEINADWAELEILRILPSVNLRVVGQQLGIASKKAQSKPLESPCGMIVLSCETTTLISDELKIKLENKPAFVLYNNNIYFIDNDWIPTLLKERVNPDHFKAILKTFSLSEDKLTHLTLSDIEMFSHHFLNDFKPFWLDKEINQFRKICLATWEDLLSLPRRTLILLTRPNSEDDLEQKNLKEHLQEAILSGGVKLQDLIDLNLDQIKIIASPHAIELYKENQFIRAKDILAAHALSRQTSSEKDMPYTPSFWQTGRNKTNSPSEGLTLGTQHPSSNLHQV